MTFGDFVALLDVVTVTGGKHRCCVKCGHMDWRVDPKSGKRQCRVCCRIRARRYKAARRVERPERIFADEFWDRVEIGPECWEFRLAPNSAGYCYFAWRGKRLRAHRVSYELIEGPIPEGLVIDHLCRNRKCVNPDHLEAVTPRVNSRRANVKTHCQRGHEFNEENTVIDKYQRTCLACRRVRDRKNKRRLSLLAV